MKIWGNRVVCTVTDVKIVQLSGLDWGSSILFLSTYNCQACFKKKNISITWEPNPATHIDRPVQTVIPTANWLIQTWQVSKIIQILFWYILAKTALWINA